MQYFLKKNTFIVVGVSLLVFLQGCDQISKLADYLSPNRASQKVIEDIQGSKEKSPAVQAKEISSEKQQITEQTKILGANILAQVGSWSISIQDFQKRLDAVEKIAEDFDPTNIEQKKYILSELLQQQLLVQEALSQKLDQTEEVRAALQDLQHTVLAQTLLTRLTENVSATDEEAEVFYKENPEFFRSQIEWRVSEIVVDSEEKAKSVLVEINQGKAFESTARTRSIAQSAGNGGDLGFLTIPTGDPQLDLNVFSFEKMAQISSALDAGEVSGSFKGPQGFYIVKLTEKKGGKIQALEEIREDLKAYIISSKQQQKLVETLKAAEEKFNVNINEQLLEE